jgi:hypothetical protein
MDKKGSTQNRQARYQVQEIDNPFMLMIAIIGMKFILFCEWIGILDDGEKGGSHV